MDIIVREYSNQDYEGLSKLLREAYDANIEEETLKQHYLGETKKIIIAANAITKKTTGCAFVEIQTDYVRPDKVLYITYVAVDEKYRGQGIGRKIIEYIETMGAKLHCNAIELTSANFRTGAHAFYKALGFTIKKTTHFIMDMNPHSTNIYIED